MEILEWIGIIDDNWDQRRTQREMEPYLFGLSKSEREIVIGELKRNKIRLEEATRLRFEELSKNAVRPTDAYHNMLMNQVVHEEKEKNTNPGTPRRRRPIRMEAV